MTTKLSNAIARNHFLHDHDTHHDTGARCCFFAERPYDGSGWGFWVRADGTVDVDETSSSGELPSRKITGACVRAAVKYLAE